MRAPPLVCLCFFPGVFLSFRVTGACPVTADLIMRVNVRTTTTTTTLCLAPASLFRVRVLHIHAHTGGLAFLLLFFPLIIPFSILALLSRSLLVVTQIRGHLASPPPPSPLRCAPSCLSWEYFSIFFPRRLASNCVVRWELCGNDAAPGPSARPTLK